MIASPSIMLAPVLAQLAGQPDPPPPHTLWPGVVIIITVAIFVTAAVAGPLIRANSDDPADSAPGLPRHDNPGE